jgi:hypothetical protein
MIEESGTIDIEGVQKENRDLLNEVKRDCGNFIANLRVGDYLDACDNQKMWRRSKVLEKSDKAVKVEFIGWEERWNEIIALSSGKLKPFRSETNFDTSSVKQYKKNKSQDILNGLLEVLHIIPGHRQDQPRELPEDLFGRRHQHTCEG